MHYLIVLLLSLPLLWSCTSDNAAPTAVPTLVHVMAPDQRDTVIYADFPGQITAMNEVAVRSKVTGVVLSQAFKEGQMVEQGQVLYQLDSDSLKAGVEHAEGRVRDAEATLAQAQSDVDRYKPLAETGVIPRKQYDDALAKLEQAKAGVSSAMAELEQTRLTMNDAVIRSPYTGRIGRSEVNEGALVTANQTVLATVSTTDSARFDFALSEPDYLKYVRPILERHSKSERKSVPVELFLADGSAYGHAGHTFFADRALSASTGTFAISVAFPNPDELLRPGMYGRARLPMRRIENALRIPQRAVQEVLGKTFLSIVDDAGMVERRAVTMGARVDGDWIIEAGVQPGEQVIVDGHHKVRPGQQVDAKPLPAQPDPQSTAVQPAKATAAEHASSHD